MTNRPNHFGGFPMVRLNIKRVRNTVRPSFDPFFAVNEIPLVRVDGVETNLRALVNDATGDQLGIVTNQYKVFTHKQASDAVKDFLGGTGLRYESKVKDTASKGARFFETITFPGLAFNPSQGLLSDALDSKGLLVDTYIPTIQIRNSYDRSLGLSWNYGLYRVVCSNGMAVLVGGDEKLSFKHSQIVNPDAVHQHLVSNLEKTVRIMEGAFTRLTGQEGNSLLGSTLNSNLSDRYKKLILEKLGDKLKIEGEFKDQEDGSQIWELSKVETDLSSYAVYQVLTEVNTHAINNASERASNDRAIAELAGIVA